MPDLWMDVDVALTEVPVNIMPLIDDTDFKTIEAAVVYNQAGLALYWHFVTTAGVMTETAVTPTTAGDYDWTDQGASGMYAIEIPASAGASVNNNAEGIGWFTGVATGILPWRGPTIGFRAATINDALIDSDTLIDNFDNGLLYESVITTVTSQTEFIMTTAFAVNDVWNGMACTLEDISTGEAYAGNIWISDCVALTNTLHISAVFPITVVAGDKIRIKDQVHPTYAMNLYDIPTKTEAAANEAAILADILETAQTLARSDAANATDNASKTAEINTNNGSGVGNYDPLTDSLEATQDIVAAIPANPALDTVCTEARLAELDPANIPSDVDAVKAKTDQLAFGVANQVNANAVSANETAILGTGVTADKWRGS
jgi:hypothetical protein